MSENMVGKIIQVMGPVVAIDFESYLPAINEALDIDFVVDNFGDRFYIQVADYLSSDEVVEREFGAYRNVADNFPKYVITMDKMNYSQDGIIHKNIIDWLLEQ